MTQEIKNIRGFYKKLGSNTRLVIRVTFITLTTLILLAIYTYTATSNPLYYEFLSLCDELLNVARSVSVVGFAGALGIGYAEKSQGSNE